MILCKRPQLTPEQRKSRENDVFLKVTYAEEQKYIKLLLLGTGESGKTTILKQMRIIHINGFSDEEKKNHVPAIKQNIHESIFSIVDSMGKIKPSLEIGNETAKLSQEYILNLGPKEPSDYTDEYLKHVKILWSDPDVQEAFTRSNEYQLIDSAQHFLDQIDTINQPNYLPTVQDILVCRTETKAISKIDFTVKVPKRYGGGQAFFSMYDVGGQRGHRKKWISVFDGIQAILFLIAASDFDQTLREDEKKNRLEESFQIFSDIFWSRYVRDAGKLVFLNKQDLLRKKIEHGKRIENYFPQYRNYVLSKKLGNPNDEYERAKHFMRDEIVKIAKHNAYDDELNIPNVLRRDGDEDRNVFIHFTVATDTDNIKLVFEDVRQLIVEINKAQIINN